MKVGVVDSPSYRLNGLDTENLGEHTKFRYKDIIKRINI